MVVCFGFKGWAEEIGWVVGLFVVGGDEIFVAPCVFVNMNQVVEFDLRVDDWGMMKY
jgi:hypothetical protein